MKNLSSVLKTCYLKIIQTVSYRLKTMIYGLKVVQIKNYGLWTLLYGLIVLFPSQLYSQENPEVDFDQFILNLFPLQDSEDGIENYDDIYEALYQFYRNPLDLNSVSREQLEALYLLSPVQVQNLLTYRERQGRILTIYELPGISGFNRTTVEKILPFIYIDLEGVNTDKRTLWQKLRNPNSHYIITRYNQILEEREGFTPVDTNSSGEANQRYLGTPEQLYIRYRLQNIGDFSIGFTAEKDIGEQYAWNPDKQQYGVDFFSFHAYVENLGRFKRIALGDYQLGIGQNLLLTAGFTVGKGVETVNTVRRVNLGIRPYTSTLESGFFRGVAVTYELGENFELTGFYSRIRRDASVVSQEVEIATEDTTLIQNQIVSENFIESIRATGLHRTQAELEAKATFLEQTYGVNFLFENNRENLQIGTTFLRTEYDIPLQRVDRVYNRFEFNGKENWNLGLNFAYNWKNFSFFGEGAQSRSGGIGLVTGFISNLSPGVDFAFLYRKFDRDFHSFYGSAFGESSRNINESGFYWGIKVEAIPRISLSAYYDSFRFPSIRFGADAPSGGYEYLARLDYNPNGRTQIFFQYREESKELNQRDNETNLDFLSPRLTNNYVFNINHRSRSNIFLKTRLQINTVRQGGMRSEGYLIFQDIGWQWRKLRLDARFAIFDDNSFRFQEDSFGSTFLYAYEKNVLWAPTIVRYSGQGTRWMLLAKYKVNRNLEFWLRFAQTQRLDQDTIGSGLDEIQGNTQSQLTAQIRWRF